MKQQPEDEPRSLQVVERRPPAPSLMTRVFSSVAESLQDAMHLVGSIIPLRGMASFAADIGLPGALTLMEMLTPSTKERT